MVNIRKVSSGHCPPRKILRPGLERRYTHKIAGGGWRRWGGHVIPGLREILVFRLSNSTPQCPETERGKKVLAVSQRSRIFSPMGSALLCLRIRRHGCPGPNLRDSDADDLSLDPDTSSLNPQVIVCSAKTPELSIAINMV